jgi:hypothetical protein
MIGTASSAASAFTAPDIATLAIVAVFTKFRREIIPFTASRRS